MWSQNQRLFLLRRQLRRFSFCGGSIENILSGHSFLCTETMKSQLVVGELPPQLEGCGFESWMLNREYSVWPHYDLVWKLYCSSGLNTLHRPPLNGVRSSLTFNWTICTHRNVHEHTADIKHCLLLTLLFYCLFHYNNMFAIFTTINLLHLIVLLWKTRGRHQEFHCW